MKKTTKYLLSTKEYYVNKLYLPALFTVYKPLMGFIPILTVFYNLTTKFKHCYKDGFGLVQTGLSLCWYS